MIEQKKQIQAVENRVLKLEAKNTTRPDYYTIVGFGVIKGIKINLNTAVMLGKKAAVICKKRNIQMDEIPDPRFGRVRMYPFDVLDEVFKEAI